MKRKKMSIATTKKYVKELLLRIEKECPDCEVYKCSTFAGSYPGVIISYIPAPYEHEILVSGCGMHIEDIIIELNHSIKWAIDHNNINTGDPNEILVQVKSIVDTFAKSIQDEVYE